jgi:hypothetical protein
MFWREMFWWEIFLAGKFLAGDGGKTFIAFLTGDQPTFGGKHFRGKWW